MNRTSAPAPESQRLTTRLTTRDAAVEVAEGALRGVLDGDLDVLSTVVHPDAINREALAEPPATRGRGPAAFHATGYWLREAFSELSWRTETTLVDEDVIVSFGTMSGRHTGKFVVWTPDMEVERVFTPTGKSFEVRQAHFQRIRDGLVVEHWAVRDDQGMGMQAGWIPPTPGFLVRCALATRRARRDLARSGAAVR